MTARTPTKQRASHRRVPTSAELASRSPCSPAKAPQSRADFMEKAEAWEKRALDQVAGLLLTRAQLGAWMNENLDVFRQRMKDAREGDRKQYSVRAYKRTGLPEDKNRMRCEAKGATYSKPSKQWVKILWRRSGWLGVTRPKDYLTSIKTFLGLKADSLDRGMSLPLQEIALCR